MNDIKFCNIGIYIIKIQLVFIFITNISFNALAQSSLPEYPDSFFSTGYNHRLSLFRQLPVGREDVIFLGNSITAGNEWGELFQDIHIKNRGISGDITAGVLHRLSDVVRQKPAKIFLLIGINDLSRGISTDSILKNVFLAADFVHQLSPETKLYIQSILPVNRSLGLFVDHTNKSDSIIRLNQMLHSGATNHHYTFIDLHPYFCDTAGRLDKNLTNDGLHLRGDGYQLWKHLVFRYVYGLREKPALIPLPRQLEWQQGFFPLFKCKSIRINDSLLYPLAMELKKYLPQTTIHLNTNLNWASNVPEIYILIDKNDGRLKEEEAYAIDISTTRVVLSGAHVHGIFNGLQTLRQLMRDGSYLDACTIWDAPAFSWRGYMLDVGRNYVSMQLLKQQIDVMAQNKLNVFHFHATEDIAWRLEVPGYPQLTAPESMLRDKGMYYTSSDIRELIDYCKDRYITFVPEIDMPGHSGAFRRALGVDMQSDSGMMYLRGILEKFCAMYDLPYIHIGGDEVHIVNKQFMPTMTQLLEKMGKQVIAWQPGGNYSESTIRQLWMDDAAHLSQDNKIKVIDSRHLYLNHLDPLETVVTLFYRQIGDVTQGDSVVMGATLCMWPDRAVSTDKDILQMNAVYPGMLAFAERCWRGGGKKGWVADINTERPGEFIEFENRLLDEKKQYFSDKQFPYVRQSNYTWKLYGPFDNGGELSKKFAPENFNANPFNSNPQDTAIGGTIILRHWWAPLIRGSLNQPAENTTWYATTKIWSDEDKMGQFWIGFNDISRSPATDSAPQGAWDTKNSAVWVNEQLIAPPQWKHPGQKGNAEIPLIDEGYTYRPPTSIPLKKGWNSVLIKAPIGSFKGRDWQNPVKWMFTFVEL